MNASTNNLDWQLPRNLHTLERVHKDVVDVQDFGDLVLLSTSEFEQLLQLTRKSYAVQVEAATRKLPPPMLFSILVWHNDVSLPPLPTTEA